MNLASFSYLLKKVDLDAIVDHLSLALSKVKQNLLPLR